MKTCKTCKCEFDLSEFHSNGQTPVGTKKYKPDCKKCEMSARRERTWNIILEIHEPKCSKCGYDKCRAALELHHTDPSQKEFEIKRLDYRSRDKLLVEMQKCIMVCSNCHKEIHYLGL